MSEEKMTKDEAVAKIVARELSVVRAHKLSGIPIAELVSAVVAARVATAAGPEPEKN
jgi:hypothetical protein